MGEEVLSDATHVLLAALKSLQAANNGLREQIIEVNIDITAIRMALDNCPDIPSTSFENARNQVREHVAKRRQQGKTLDLDEVLKSLALHKGPIQ